MSSTMRSISVSPYQAKASVLFPSYTNITLGIFYLMMFVLPFLRPLFNPTSPESFMGFLCMNLCIGALVNGTAKEILCNPFSFTLPNHISLIRSFLLRIGIVCNLCFILIMFLFPADSIFEKLSAMVAVFTCGNALFLASCIVSYRWSWMGGALFLGVLVMLTFFLQLTVDYLPYQVLADAIVSHPVLFTLLWALLFWLFIDLFNNENIFRELIGKPTMGLVESANPRLASEFMNQYVYSGMNTAANPDSWLTRFSDRFRPKLSHPYYCLRHKPLLLLRKVQLLSNPKRLLMNAIGLIPLLFIALYINKPLNYYTYIALIIWLFIASISIIESTAPQLPYNRKDMARTEILWGFLSSFIALFVGYCFMLLCEVTGSLIINSPVELPSTAILSFIFIFIPFQLLARLYSRGRINLGYLFFFLGMVIIASTYHAAEVFINAGLITWISCYLISWGLYLAGTYWKYCKQDLVSNAD